jgi:hypothetical protein
MVIGVDPVVGVIRVIRSIRVKVYYDYQGDSLLSIFTV